MHRRSLRLRGYDYTSDACFVTTCTGRRRRILGRIVADAVHLSEVGTAAEQCMREIQTHHRNVLVDWYVVMPNHVHAVLVVDGPSLGVVVGTYKAAVARATGIRGLWQRGYHDHVIRDEEDLLRAREYIATNPIRWSLDPENPDRS